MEKRYDYTKCEKEVQKLWQDLNIHGYQPNTNKPIYSIDTPPPTVSGALHIGHIFSYTQAEIIARYKRMRGYNLFYPFGFDDNGLPTERLVERDHKTRADQMTQENFTDLCLKTTAKYETEFKTLWESLGFSCDWSLQYETISPTTQRIAQRSFIELYQNGLAYRKSAPVLWCPHCQTSIAQADVDSQEKTTHFLTLKFQLAPGTSNGEAIDIQAPSQSTQMDTLLIATTRPEMLYGCVAIFVHPNDERYQLLGGRLATVPIYGHQVPILRDEAVAMDKGTGAVMCCTFGDSTDLTWYDSHNLPYRETLMPDGRLNPIIPIIGGLNTAKAREGIIAELYNQEIITHQEMLEHNYSVHERCGKGIEILPSPQWYIDLLNHKEAFLKAGDAINWHPAHMKTRYMHWVQNLKWDWCISRQRFFGTPFPVWYCKDCGATHIANEAEYDLPINPKTSKPKQPCHCGSNDFEAESAIMDTWMTSSVTPQINQKWGEKDQRKELTLPMGLRTQAHEIIRTWAFYTIAKSHFHSGQIPWTDIMISGFVLAKKGEKISKSKDNSTQSPKALIEIHSADAVRYWTAGNKLGTDTYFDPSELQNAKRLMTKLWSAARFIFAQLADFTPNFEEIEGFRLKSENNNGLAAENKSEVKMLPIDTWLVERSYQVLDQMAGALDDFEMGAARQAMDGFFWSDLCDDYLEFAKERLYQPERHGFWQQNSGRTALYVAFLNILKGYAIYMPHVTETLYQAFYAGHEALASLHLHQWEVASEGADHKDAGDQQGFDDLMAFGAGIKSILTDARRYKSENGLSMKAEMPAIVIDKAGMRGDWLQLTLADLLACTHASSIQIR